jgi:hypothetical protein
MWNFPLRDAAGVPAAAETATGILRQEDRLAVIKRKIMI